MNPSFWFYCVAWLVSGLYAFTTCWSVSNLLFQAWQSKFISCLVLWGCTFRRFCYLQNKNWFYERGPLNCTSLFWEKQSGDSHGVQNNYTIVPSLYCSILYDTPNFINDIWYIGKQRAFLHNFWFLVCFNQELNIGFQD